MITKLPLIFLEISLQELISNHMEALLKLPIVISVHETKNLRDLYDKIEINIQSLKALGIESVF